MGEKCKKNMFGIRPSVSFCSASTKNFHVGASLIEWYTNSELWPTLHWTPGDSYSKMMLNMSIRPNKIIDIRKKGEQHPTRVPRCIEVSLTAMWKRRMCCLWTRKMSVAWGMTTWWCGLARWHCEGKAIKLVLAQRQCPHSDTHTTCMLKCVT